MVILGINASHLATAALFKDGRILACISEERLTRVKNQGGFPYKAVKECLRITGLKAGEVDYLAFSFKDPLINSGFSVLGTEARPLEFSLFPLVWRLKEWMLANIPKSRAVYQVLTPLFYDLFLNPFNRANLLQDINSKLGIGQDKVLFADHHTSHAYAAYFACPDFDKSPKLVLTLDAMGDGLCSSVSIAKNGHLKRIAESSSGNSLGDLYAYITSFMGLKRGEHEFKVMGLAPYASNVHFMPLYEKLRELIWVNDDLTFSTKVHSQVFYQVLDDVFYHQRFDNIAGAIQKLTEDLLCEWVQKAVRKTGISEVVCGGGVFMNVKANQLISQLSEVKKIYVVPSCGDESTAIGAAFWAFEQHGGPGGMPIQPVKELYLGTEYSDIEIEKELKKSKYQTLKYSQEANIEKKVAKLLSQGAIVARFKGRSEWGARALGNRSILANPSNFEVIKEINDQIKSRDFWMPFAPSILSERLNKYVENPKHLEVPYMIMTLDSTEKGKKELVAAMHPYDGTLRPQEVYKDWNPAYWNLISEFEKLTGIGGVLNTSFNLHGFPIVQTPEDALYVLQKSGLKYLALGSFLISKT